jgi:hypothetical protein
MMPGAPGPLLSPAYTPSQERLYAKIPGLNSVRKNDQ